MVDLEDNMVLQYQSEENIKIRIIWIDEYANYLYFIELDRDTSMPQIAKVEEFKELIDSNELLIIPDPYGYSLNDEKLPKFYKSWRERMWRIVEYLWYEHQYELLSKSSRNKLINKVSLEFGETNRQVRRILTRFWQRGMVKNSLLPDYMNSGGEGKIKKSGNKKRGREPEYSQSSEGINVNAEILKIIRASIGLFYKKSNKKPIKQAYDCMIAHFFTDKSIIDGKEKYLVQKKNTFPTYRQFYYWLRKELSVKETHISRYGKKSYELHLRELLGNSTIHTFGPGSKYQIDATVADVYLVSTLDRNKLIGRPVVYIVIDIYLRLIVGVYVGLEGPSWLGAMMALDNVVEDKVKFCLQYGIDIDETQWPNSYLPEAIIADRGEFEGYNPSNLINNLGIQIRNTPPYRGDLKGIVERYFRTMNEKIKHMTPGGVLREYKQRGDRDTRYDAIMDLNGFTKLMIGEIIHHNNSIINDYPREQGLIAEGILPKPIDIWNWGIKNRACGFKVKDRDIIRLNLLYRETASITREGIKLPGKLGKLYYSCEEAIKEQWFINRTNEKVEIAYDPRKMDHIYIPINKGNEYITCKLLDKCITYKNLRQEEVIFEYESEHELIEENRDKQRQVNVDRVISAEEIIKGQKRKTKNSINGNKRSRTKDVKETRSTEKEMLRKSQAFELGILNENSKVQQDSNSLNSDNCVGMTKPGIKLNLVKNAKEKSNER